MNRNVKDHCNHKEQTSDQFGITCYIYQFRYFLLKREITFEVASFRGLLLSEDQYFWKVATFGGSLLSGGRYFRNFTVVTKALSNPFCLAFRFVCIVLGFEFVDMLQFGNGVREVNSVFVFLFMTVTTMNA